MTNAQRMSAAPARPAVPPRREEGKKNTAISKRFGGWLIVFLLLAVGAILLGVIFGVFDAMFRLKQVVVEGVEPNEAILAAADLSAGDRLYTIDSGEVRAAVLRDNPYLADVRLERRLPDTVALICTPRSGAYYLEVDGEWIALSHDLMVLECGASPEDYAARGMVELILPQVQSAVTGRRLSFVGSFDDSYLLELLEMHRTSPLYERTDLLRVENRFDVRMIVDTLYAVTLGDCTDMSLKLTLTEKILADSTFSGKSGAFLDLTNPAEGSAILDKMTDYSMLWRE